jgi:3-oxoacyl-[acyl-carrier protein] reductase
MVVYAATKSAVDAITRVLARELGPKKIHVNAVAPGATETEGLHALGVPGSDYEKHIVSQTPLGRLGQPSDIASAVASLASADAAWITGETIRVSGGQR